MAFSFEPFTPTRRKESPKVSLDASTQRQNISQGYEKLRTMPKKKNKGLLKTPSECSVLLTVLD
jgi:hypothetical protein